MSYAVGILDYMKDVDTAIAKETDFLRKTRLSRKESLLDIYSNNGPSSSSKKNTESQTHAEDALKFEHDIEKYIEEEGITEETNPEFLNWYRTTQKDRIAQAELYKLMRTLPQETGTLGYKDLPTLTSLIAMPGISEEEEFDLFQALEGTDLASDEEFFALRNKLVTFMNNKNRRNVLVSVSPEATKEYGPRFKFLDEQYDLYMNNISTNAKQRIAALVTLKNERSLTEGEIKEFDKLTGSIKNLESNDEIVRANAASTLVEFMSDPFQAKNLQKELGVYKNLLEHPRLKEGFYQKWVNDLKNMATWPQDDYGPKENFFHENGQPKDEVLRKEYKKWMNA